MAIWDPLFYEMCWNKVGTAHRTTRLISLALLPNPECPKYGPMGAKNRLKIAFWPYKSAHMAYFELEGVLKGWNINKDIQTDQFGQFARP